MNYIMDCIFTHMCIMLPKISEYAKSFDETKGMSFLIKHEELLKNTVKSGIKSVIVFKKELIKRTSYNAEYFTTKNLMEVKSK